MIYPASKMQGCVETELAGLPTVKLRPTFDVATLEFSIRFRNLSSWFPVKVVKADVEVRMLGNFCASQQIIVGEWAKSSGGRVDYKAKIVLTDECRKRLMDQWDKTNKMPFVFSVVGTFETFFSEFKVPSTIEGPLIPDVWRDD